MLKVTWLFQQDSGDTQVIRSCGWSETWYLNTSLSVYLSRPTNFAKRRAQLLTSKAAIIGCRIRQLNGPVENHKLNEVGAIVTTQDIPQMALSCYTKNAAGDRTKYFRIRGLPDARVENGVFVPSAGWVAAWTAFGTMLAAESWAWQGIDDTKPKIKITSIDANGNVVLASGGTFNLGDNIIIRRCRSTAGKRCNGVFNIIAKTDNQHFQIANWVAGTVGTVGTASVLAFVYPVVGANQTAYNDVTTQKVGRPFNSYRGRVTKK